MKRFFPILSILSVLAILAVAGAAIIEVPEAIGRNISVIVGGSPNECDGKLVCENFEGTGTPSGWTTSGSTNFDYATSPAPLRGTQSLRLGAGDPDSCKSVTFTADQIWIHFILDITTSKSGDMITIEDSGGATLAGIYPTNTTTITAFVEGGDSNYSVSLSQGTIYHVWMRYQRGTSDNAQFDVYIGTSTTRPESPSFSATNGTSENAPYRIAFAGNTYQDIYIVDQLIVDDAVFTTVDP